MKKMHQFCPICGNQVKAIPRYPKYVCDTCAQKTTDAKGRKVSFSSSDIESGDDVLTISEGCYGFYKDTQKKYRSKICYIQGIKCRADLARFGGIVIEIFE